MNDETAKVLVDQIIGTLPDLVHMTIEDYRHHAEEATAEIQMQWRLLILLVQESEGLWPEAEYRRFAEHIEAALIEVEAAFDEIDGTAPHSTPPLEESQKVQYVDANPKPVESLWTEDELKQFTTKGA